MRSSWRSLFPLYRPSGSIPCSSETTSQNLAPKVEVHIIHEHGRKVAYIDNQPIWLPHCYRVSRQTLAWSRLTRARRNTYLASLKVDDFAHSAVERELVAFYVRNGTFWNARKIAFSFVAQRVVLASDARENNRVMLEQLT